MLAIHMDVQITRRKRVHIVVNTEGQVLYAAASLGDVLAWLTETAQEAITLQAQDGTCYHIDLRQLPLPLGRPRPAATENEVT